MRSLVISFVSAIVLIACAGPSKQASTSPEVAKPGEETPPSKPDQPSPPEKPKVEPKPPPCPADKAQAQDIAQHVAINLLDEGREAEAKSELQKALCMDRNNALAVSLMNQITSDPAAYFAEKYGNKSFKYIVKSGDTLSKIAAANLGDPYQFYILARYNGISVPKSVHKDQVIKVPGASTVATSSSTSTQTGNNTNAQAVAERYQAGQQALIVGEKDKAYDLFMQAWRLDPRDQRPRADAEKLKPELIAAHDRKAREAYARRDLDRAIAEWSRVLELDSSNATALREKQRAIDLQRMANEIPEDKK